MINYEVCMWQRREAAGERRQEASGASRDTGGRRRQEAEEKPYCNATQGLLRYCTASKGLLRYLGQRWEAARTSERINPHSSPLY